MKNIPRKCQSFKVGHGGKRRCARFVPDSDSGLEPDTAMHRGGFAGFPGFDVSVNSGDLLMGSAAGLLAGSGTRWLVNKYATAWMPAALMPFVPVAGGALAAWALYAYSAGQGKKARAVSHATGAVGASVVVSLWDALRKQFPQLADLSAYSGYGYGYLTAGVSPNSGSPAAQGYAMLQPSTGYQGIVVDTGNPSMNELALSAMGEDEDYRDYRDYGY